MKRWIAPRTALALWMALCGAALLWCVAARAASLDTNAPPTASKGWPERLSDLNGADVLQAGGAVLGVVAYLAAALFVSRALNRWIGGYLVQRAKQTANHWDDLVVTLLNGPIQVVTLAILLNFGMDLFHWEGALRLWCEKAINVLVSISVLLVALRGIDAVVEIWKRRLPDDGDKDFHHNFLVLVGKLSKVIVVIVGAFTLLSHLNVDIKPALASVSIAGLAFGLAAQDTVSNLFGAVVVFVDRPFRLGDRIRVGDVDGMVESIGVRATRVRSLDGYLVTVPNKNIGSNTVVNISRRGTIKVELNYGLIYETSAARMAEATALLERIFRGHPRTHDVIVTFDKFHESSLNINVVYWCKTIDWKEYCRSLQEIQLEVKARFDEAGFGFAFPSQTTYHRFEPGAPAAAPWVAPAGRSQAA